MNRNLLILGAGQYSHVVRETAEAMGCFDQISFLDDRSESAIGKLSEFARFKDTYSQAVVSIGNNRLRLELITKLQEAGFTVPSLIHPRAYISPSAQIGPGSIVEPFAVVQSNVSVGTGCILSATAVVNHNAVIEDGAHCDCGSVVSARGLVPACRKISYGTVVYPSSPDEGSPRYPEAYNADIGI